MSGNHNFLVFSHTLNLPIIIMIGVIVICFFKEIEGMFWQWVAGCKWHLTTGNIEIMDWGSKLEDKREETAIKP
nr:hypothetical protein [Providencia rettgeri]